MARRGKMFVSSLDVGTFGTVVLTGGPNQVLHTPAGIGRCPSLGMRKGFVVDDDSAAQSIRRAADAAGEAAGIRIDSAWVGFSGCGMNVAHRKAGMLLKRTVKISDTNYLLDLARQVDLPASRQVIQVFPVEFSLDGVSGVKNPLGRYASHLEVTACLVTVDNLSVNRLFSAVQKAGIRVIGLWSNALVTGVAVLNKVEKELGVALVDLGGGTTGVTIYNDGNFVNAEILPVGGDHITSDLAIGLRLSLAEAEEIKRRAGLLPLAELVEIWGERFTAAGCRKIMEIILLRLQEILELVKRTINRLSAGRSLTAGVVLTGGGALLKGLPEMAARVLGLPVRVGVPDFASTFNGPDLAAAWGLNKFARRFYYQEEGRLAPAAGHSLELKSGLLNKSF